MDESTAPPLTYQVIRETWLTRRPGKRARFAVGAATAALGLGSLIYWTNLAGLRDGIAASGAAVFGRHQYWRLWTTLFAHADLGHLLANSFLFIFLGYFLNAYFGGYVFPWAALAFGGVTNFVALKTYPPELTLIGASGVVSWMGGAWLTLYVLLNRQKTRGQRALRAAGVALAVFAPSEAFDPQISYRTHVIGFVIGVIWAGAYYLIKQREFEAAERIETIIEYDDLQTQTPTEVQ